ncbi:MAG: 4a-hydroxytetrahydrobiopterin dehydratase [Actinomycetota bacterium]|nr:4a-hydroxytetrahydrobiopterin dehydratase [Actinomycetota bacterium]
MADYPETPSPPSPPSRERLDAGQVAAGLEGLPGWEGDESTIVRKATMADFLAAVELVTAVAQVAEAMDHHPDIDIRWRTVRFALSTHSSGGVTETDLAAASAIERLIGRSQPLS